MPEPVKKLLTLLILALICATAAAQKPRPDAFPPLPDTAEAKGLTMATTIEEMLSWDKYPTYEVYVNLMREYETAFPNLCRLDTIGTSASGRLILCIEIAGNVCSDTNRPEFFYSSTMHGDELTGYYLMLRLCDTLLNSYGTAERLTRLLDSTRVFINPLANPDGTYFGGNNTVEKARRYNANLVDLNRNYPDPFGTAALDTLQPENAAMIAYVSRRHFRLGANLHGGSEVLNYPWDSFTTQQQENEYADWWRQVCRRYVDTVRHRDSERYRDVEYRDGYTAGGDWYVISNGRQDYFNYCHHLREMTLEVSSVKKLPNSQLAHYWDCNAQALINYIGEIHSIDGPLTAPQARGPLHGAKVYPNPTRGPVTIETPAGRYHFDLSRHAAGISVITAEGVSFKIVKLP